MKGQATVTTLISLTVGILAFMGGGAFMTRGDADVKVQVGQNTLGIQNLDGRQSRFETTLDKRLSWIENALWELAKTQKGVDVKPPSSLATSSVTRI